MDNLSHAVAGLAAGELVHRILPAETDSVRDGLRRRLLLVTGALASNFPDLDLVLTPLLPAPLGYLLHHRGHTHTFLYAFPQALLLAGLLWLLWPAARDLLRQSSSARKGFLATLGIGFVLHILMDGLNSYGIHPFHPFDSGWIYGDMVFILEPVFWVAFGVTMAMMVRSLPLRILLIALLLGVPLYFTTRAFLPWAAFLALVTVAAALGTVQYLVGGRSVKGVLAAFLVACGFVALQAAGSHQARLAVTQTLQQLDPASRVHDISLASFPTNPACWAFASVESNEAGGSYRLRRGIISTIPVLLPVSACPAALAEGAADKAMTPAIALLAEEQGSLQQLRALKRDNCHVEAWLRFARIPAVSEEEATDIRFASTPNGNFTTLRFADFADRECPKYVPGWDHPRADMLSGTGGGSGSGEVPAP